jgi:protein-S-isoprenylcysteine O-methyltransferase Ste14
VSRTFAVVRTLLIGTLFLSIWLYWLPLWFAHIEHVSLAPRNQWTWPIFTLGFALSFWCAMEFALRGRGTPAPFDPPRRLVITGLYRWVRNPMYVGMAIMLIGEALLLPQIWREMAALIAVLSIAVTVMVARKEEPDLRRLFGAEYEAYCRQVPRWIPRLTPLKREDHLQKPFPRGNQGAG